MPEIFIIAGNLAKDPDVRYTVNKRAYARLSVAVSFRRKDPSGEWKDSVDYIPVVTWGTTAENCGKYLKKGNGVYDENLQQQIILHRLVCLLYILRLDL